MLIPLLFILLIGLSFLLVLVGTAQIHMTDINIAIDRVLGPPRKRRRAPGPNPAETLLPAAGETPYESGTASFLLSCLGWGLIQTSLVQRISALVVADMQALGVQPQGSLLKLSQLGACGYWQGNSRRDLMRWLRPKLAGLPQPSLIRVPYEKDFIYF